jgi:Asp-tRNA(Asn)/Glu-tRNA(Gln) amidotransferase A subunit family amidase
MSSTPQPATPSDRPTRQRAARIVAALNGLEAGGEVGRLVSSGACAAMVLACLISDRPISDSLSDRQFRSLLVAIANEALAEDSSSNTRINIEDLDVVLTLMAILIQNAVDRDEDAVTTHRHLSDLDCIMSHLRGPLTTHLRHLMEAIEVGERRADVANLDLLATYERTERLGTPLHSVVALLEVPRRREGGPLHGVAIAVKDFIDVQGVARGHGNLSSMTGELSAVDAPVITSLREAGADVYATTTMLEYAAVAMHPDIREAMNPFDHARTAGGSSGGSAALVGVGGCSVSLGTDTGGSIRIPAHYCGVVGFKPSYDALSRDGVQTFAPTLDHVGLFGHDVAIVERVFSAITGRAIVPEVARRLRVGVDRSQMVDPVISPEVREVLIDAMARITEESDVLDIDGGAFAEIRTTWDDIILFEAWQTHGERVRNDPQHYGPETLRFLEISSMVSRNAYLDALAKRSALLPRTELIYEGFDVVATPAAPYVAPLTMPTFDSSKGEIEARFTGIYNVTGAPAIVLPCGFSSSGLPVGIQLSAPIDADMDLLMSAARIESLLNFESRFVSGRSRRVN